MKIWKPVMQKYFQQIPRTGFSQPPRKIQVGKQVRVPSLNGLSIAAATRKLERSGFTVEKRYVYSDKVPKYGFIGWSPGPGSTGSRSSARCTRCTRTGVIRPWSPRRRPTQEEGAEEEEEAAIQPSAASDVPSALPATSLATSRDLSLFNAPRACRTAH